MLNVLITGAASGIGKVVMNKYLENNHKVFAVDITPIKVDNMNNIKSFVVDITKPKDVKEVKEYLLVNNIKLDLIINIAGIHKMASLVESDYELIKKVIDVNLNGPMLINNTLYPLLKKKGKIIIVTSEVVTLNPLPFNGIYSVSKTALDTYAQSLRQELNLLNQKVITIRPGAISTPLQTGALADTESLAEKTVLFKKESRKFLSITKKFMGKPLNPEKLGKLIYKVSIKKNPKYIYKIHHNIGLKLLSILPKRLQCSIIKFILK